MSNPEERDGQNPVKREKSQRRGSQLMNKVKSKVSVASTKTMTRIRSIRQSLNSVDGVAVLTGKGTNRFSIEKERTQSSKVRSNHNLYHKRTIESSKSERKAERDGKQKRKAHGTNDDDASSSSSLFDEEFEDERMESRIPVVSVFGYTAQVTTVLLTFIAAWNSFVIPFYWAFHPLWSREVWTISSVFTQGLDLLYFLSVLISFRISYIDIESKDEVFVPQEIFWHRLSSKSLYADLASSVPLPLGSTIHACLKLLRCYRLFTVSMTFLHLEFTTAFLIGRLVCSVLYFSHLVACVWFHIIDMQGKSDQYLAKGYDVSSPPWAYWISLRDGVYIMFSRPVAALNNPEIALNIALTPVGAMVPAIIFGNINWLFQRVNGRSMKDYEELSFVKQALKQAHNVPVHLKKRILNYRRYMQIHQDNVTLEQLLARLSPPLLMELKLYLLSELLPSAEFFRGFTPMLLKSVVLSLNLCIFPSGDFVIQKNETAKEMYFVIRGLVEILAELDKPPINRFTKGQHFGELALSRKVVDSKNLKRTAWAVAQEFCHLAKLGREAFDQMLLEFPDSADLLISKIETPVRHTKDSTSPMTISFQPSSPKDVRRSIEEILSASIEVTKEPEGEEGVDKDSEADDESKADDESDADLGDDADEKLISEELNSMAWGSREKESSEGEVHCSKQGGSTEVDASCSNQGSAPRLSTDSFTPGTDHLAQGRGSREGSKDSQGAGSKRGSANSGRGSKQGTQPDAAASSSDAQMRVMSWPALKMKARELAIEQVRMHASLARLRITLAPLSEVPALTRHFLGEEPTARPTTRQSVKLEWKVSKGMQDDLANAAPSSGMLARSSTKGLGGALGGAGNRASLSEMLVGNKVTQNVGETSAPREDFVKSLFNAESAARHAPNERRRSSLQSIGEEGAAGSHGLLMKFRESEKPRESEIEQSIVRRPTKRMTKMRRSI